MVALGILVFAVVAMIGLLSVGLTAEKSSHVDTVDSMMAAKMAASLRTNNLAAWDTLSFSTNYFDHGGKPLTTISGSYFACIVKALPADPMTSPWATAALRRFQLTIISPTSSPSPTTNVFYSAIARPLD